MQIKPPQTDFLNNHFKKKTKLLMLCKDEGCKQTFQTFLLLSLMLVESSIPAGQREAKGRKEKGIFHTK